jgi:hypothetical protein
LANFNAIIFRLGPLAINFYYNLNEE